MSSAADGRGGRCVGTAGCSWDTAPGGWGRMADVELAHCVGKSDRRRWGMR